MAAPGSTKYLLQMVAPWSLKCQFTSRSLTWPLGMGLVAKGLQKQFERFARQLLPVALARINDKSTLARAARFDRKILWCDFRKGFFICPDCGAAPLVRCFRRLMKPPVDWWYPRCLETSLPHWKGGTTTVVSSLGCSPGGDLWCRLMFFFSSFASTDFSFSLLATLYLIVEIWTDLHYHWKNIHYIKWCIYIYRHLYT